VDSRADAAAAGMHPAAEAATAKEDDGVGGTDGPEIPERFL